MLLEPSLYWYSWTSDARPDEIIAVGAPAGQVYQLQVLSTLLYPLGPGAAPCPTGLLVTRAAYTAIDGFETSFHKQYASYDDQTFLAKICLRYPVYISGAWHNKYRQRPGSIMDAGHDQTHYHQVRRHFLEWFKGYLRATNSSNKTIDKLLAQALQSYQHQRLRRLASAARALPGRLRRLPKRVGRWLGGGQAPA